MTDSASYLYAITRPVPAEVLADLRGVGGTAVRAVNHRGLACLVSTVALAEFGEQALRHNLEDLAWLEATARAHDDVVRQAARHVTTAPLRLATVCRDDDAVRARLREIGPRASDVLARLDNRVEWGLKIFAPPSTERDPVPVASAASASAEGVGTAYLRRRRAESAQREKTALFAAADAESVYDRLAALAVAGRRHRPQDPRLSGVDVAMLLNAAFLVDVADSADFQASAEDIASERAAGSVVLTGPWPPYSFASLDSP
jgi:hypothetical protein